jgi:hypothetical protein
VQIGHQVDPGDEAVQLGERDPQLVLDRAGDREGRVVGHGGGPEPGLAEAGEVATPVLAGWEAAYSP